MPGRGPNYTDGGRPDGNPQRESVAYDHRELVSLLADADLAFARDPHAADEESVYEADAVDDGTVFPQSVASGGPTPSGVILWTRIAPDAFDPDEPLAVVVAREDDPEFADPCYRGVVDDADAIHAHDHTVKVDLKGVLEPDGVYHYRFVHRGTASRTGRCRTLPAPDASVESLRLAVMTCQDYANGYFGALGRVAEADVDFLVHVGDFIYESTDGEFTGIGSPDLPDRDLELPVGDGRTRDLADYRYLHRTYRTDRLLQRALEAHTLIPAWDDHEIANDIYWDDEVDAPRADHPLSGDPAAMTRLTADAMHAWWEYMPARINYHPEADRLQERFELWRTVRFGDLVDLVMTDERLFRDPPKDVPGGVPTREATAPKYEPEDRSMLGAAQREWFLETVADSDATWTVWTDEVLTVPLKVGAGPLTLFPVQGGWDGYVRERRQIMEHLDARDVENFVTLTGDAHCYLAGYQQTRYDDTLGGLLFGTAFADERVGVEFMTPPTTSVNVAEALGVASGLRRRLTEPILSTLLPAMNPHLAFFDSHHCGYSVVEFTPSACRYLGYGVDKTEDSADADAELLVAMRVPEGRVEIQDVTEPARRTDSRRGR